MNAPSLAIDGIIIPVAPHLEHEYTLTTSEVAAGYGISEITLRRHKSAHADELVEGKHFLVVVNESTGVHNLNARQKGLKRGNDTVTRWTKRGIVRLGFFIRSERAKRFRDLAEDLVVREIDGAAGGTSARLPFDPVAVVESKIAGLDVQSKRGAEALGALIDLRGRLAGHAAMQATQPSAAARRGRPPGRAYLPSAERRGELARFFREHVEATGESSDRLRVGVLFVAYLHWCRDSATCPHYHSVNTLSKALLAAVPGLRGHYRRCLLPDGGREVCYLGHRLGKAGA